MDLALYTFLLVFVLIVHTYQSYVGFEITHVGLNMPIDFTFETVADIELHECMRLCMISPKCKSFNYNTVTMTCEMNDEILGMLKPNSDYIFVEKSSLPQGIGSTCNTNSCNGAGLCIPSTPSACVVTCEDPPNLGYAIVDPGSAHFYSTRTYRCSSLTPTMSPDDGTGTYNITCQANGTWTASDFSCQ